MTPVEASDTPPRQAAPVLLARGCMASEDVRIAFDGSELGATLEAPRGARGLVLFAHGSGSSRFSPRNRFVARELVSAGLATLLLDLLTEEEEARDAISGQWRFDIELLTERLVLATDWAKERADLAELGVGYFGASTGAAAALVAATERPSRIQAVSRGGRPDLAGDRLAHVRAPTLLVVGGDDRDVLRLNCAALAALRCEKRLEIVPGATHLFEEPGALEAVARLARDWFTSRLRRASNLHAPLA